MELATALKATKDGFQFVRDLRSALQRQEVNPNEVSDRLLQVQELLLEMQVTLAETQEENRGLRRQLEEQQRVADIGNQFSDSEGVFWYNNYPYCPNCWNVDRKPMRLNGPYASASDANSSWTCPIHNSKYYLRRRQW